MQPLTNLEEIAFNSGSSFDTPPRDQFIDSDKALLYYKGNNQELEKQVTKLTEENTKLKQDLAIKRRDLRIVEFELKRLLSCDDGTSGIYTQIGQVAYLLKLLKAR